jgi:hypothetical protein
MDKPKCFTIASPLPVSGKRRRMPYWDAKEVMDNDWKVDGLDPMGYYDEITEDEE